MMAALIFDEIKKLVSDNNNSKEFSDAFVICLAWKESEFDPEAANAILGYRLDAVDQGRGRDDEQEYAKRGTFRAQRNA